MRVSSATWVLLLVLGFQALAAPQPVAPAAPASVEPAPSQISAKTLQYLPLAEAPSFAAPPSNYSPPPGFGGHAWGDLRKDFRQLPADAASVTAAWSRNEKSSSQLHCTGSGKVVVPFTGLGGPVGSAIGGGVNNGVAGCSLNEMANSMRPTLTGADFHVLSEYSISGQGFRMADVLLFPVVYEFCAQWEKGRREIPANFEEINQYCGMRLLFPVESPSQLAGLPQDHVTQFDLVLNELISHYGNPDDVVSAGQQSAIEASTPGVPRRDREFRTWRWCPMGTQPKATSCAVSIVLAADPQAAQGIVIFATPALWRYAEARENSLGMPDGLYTLLHGLSIPQREQQRQLKLAEASAAQARAAAEKAARKKVPEVKASPARTIYEVAISEQ